jgi:hypothetical protein
MLAMLVTDTSPGVHALQIRLYREAGPERRAAMAADLSEAVREFSRAGVRLRHPEFSEAEVNRELLRILYGLDGNKKR